jgi:hypothetical protein
MNYKLRAINDDSISLNGTHGQGSIITTMRNLTLAFGECEEEENDKTRYMWFLKFETDEGEDVVADIYDYKNYDEDNGLRIADIELDEIFEWNIGGTSAHAVYAICDALRKRDVSFAGVKVSHP